MCALQEKVAIQAVQGTHSANIVVYAQSISGGTVTLDSVIVKDSAGTVIGTVSTGITYAVGSTSATGIGTALTTITFASPSGVAQGNAYNVTLISKAGGSFVSPSFTAA